MASSAAQVTRVVTGDPSVLDVTDGRWKAFVARRGDALAYHDPRWARLIASCYGYRAFVVAISGSNGALAAGLPVVEVRRPLTRPHWVSLPFSDVCPPLGDDDHLGALTAALEAARREAGASHVEVRAPLPAPAAGRESGAVTHTLELTPDLDRLFATFHRSQVQRNVRRGVREGVVVRTAETEADIARTYYRLHVATRRRLGVPVQPRRFFAELWRQVLEPGLGFALLAYAGARPIAGAVFLAGNSTVTYKYGASDAAYRHLRPNHTLFWTAIARAAEAEYHSFDFGRSDHGDEGLIAFKRGWGTREGQLAYSTLGPSKRPARSRRGMPAARAVIRHAPPFVCRATGALLYRYAA
jgi:CelD/BcsL family acetyltransferase involved in cellulose biosynthesis